MNLVTPLNESKYNETIKSFLIQQIASLYLLAMTVHINGLLLRQLMNGVDDKHHQPVIASNRRARGNLSVQQIASSVGWQIRKVETIIKLQ